MEKSEKFQRPVWLEGKVYSVAKSVPELSTFVECVERAGYDELIDVSGLYTVMAPTNTAFDEYFAENGTYGSIEDMDSVALHDLIKMHIVLRSWSTDQLRALNTSGWIDNDTEDARYTGFKRETLFNPENKIYKVTEKDGERTVIDPYGSTQLVVYSEYNKFAPFFYSEYLNYSDVISSDFEFYFDRPFESSDIYYAGAKLLSTGEDLNEDGIIDESYAAENGYVYLIDKVIEPLPSAEEFLDNMSNSSYEYDVFGDLIDQFAEFTYNEKATYLQDGANEGLEVDQLYDISYPLLTFNVSQENTHATSAYSIAYHNALFAPTNEAYNSFIDQVILSGSGHYSEKRNIPDVLLSMIADAHMVKWTPYYPSQTGKQGIISNALDEKIYESDVNAVETIYGSNATLVGIDKVMIPRVFQSVVAPLALRKDYSYFFGAIYLSGILSTLNNLDAEFTLFSVSDASFDRDSTFRLVVSDDLIEGYDDVLIEVLDRENQSMINLRIKSNDGISVSSLLNGQIALGTPKGTCDKEYLPTLSGHYIEFDFENNLVSGDAPTALDIYGNEAYGTLDLDLNVQLAEDYGAVYGQAPRNGKTYSVESWFSFVDDNFKSSVLKENSQSSFYDLLMKAGLIDASIFKMNFLDEGELLTVLIPTDAALATVQADTLVGEELIDFLKGHFIIGTTIFTDNINKTPSPTSYLTKSGGSLKLASSQADAIDILNEDGSIYFTIHENDKLTNNMYLGWDDGDDNDGSSLTSKGLAGIYVVTHVIDQVILPEVLF